jgi:hypothetical protein
MSGHDSAQHPHGAAGVAAVKRPAGPKAADAAAVDGDERWFAVACCWGS